MRKNSCGEDEINSKEWKGFHWSQNDILGYNPGKIPRRWSRRNKKKIKSANRKVNFPKCHKVQMMPLEKTMEGPFNNNIKVSSLRLGLIHGSYAISRAYDLFVKRCTSFQLKSLVWTIRSIRLRTTTVSFSTKLCYFCQQFDSLLKSFRNR